MATHERDIPGGPTEVDLNIASLNPSNLRPGRFERLDTELTFFVTRRKPHQHTNSGRLHVLRSCDERPRARRPADDCDEITPSHVGPTDQGRIIVTVQTRHLENVLGLSNEILPTFEMGLGFRDRPGDARY